MHKTREEHSEITQKSQRSTTVSKLSKGQCIGSLILQFEPDWVWKKDDEDRVINDAQGITFAVVSSTLILF